MSESQRLLRRIQSGEIDVLSISDEDLYELTFDQLKETRFAERPVQRRRHRDGAVAMVIEEVGAARQHYVDCNRHPDELTLDVAARAFCAAIREKPASLTLVTTRRLSRQARDYAQSFFRTPRHRGHLRDIDFDTQLLHRLFGTDQQKPKTVKLHVEYWYLTREDPFGAVQCASSVGAHGQFRPCIVDTDRVHRLHIDIEGLEWSQISEGVLLDSDGALVPWAEPVGEEDMSSLSSLEFRLHLNRLLVAKSPPRIERLRLTTRTGAQIALDLRLPDLKLHSPGRLLPEVRPGFTRGLVDDLTRPEGVNLLFLAGPGGVGKSHLATNICTSLVDDHGYRAFKLTGTSESGEGFILQLLLQLVDPDSIFGSAHSTTVDPVARMNQGALTIVRAFLERICGERYSDSESLVRRILALDVGDIEFEALAYLCGRVMSRMPWPYAVLIQDCHKLPYRVIAGLDHLLSVLMDSGSTTSKLLLEYRDADGDTTPEWRHFVDDRRATSPQTTRLVCVAPVSLSDLEQSLSGRVAEFDHRELARSVYRKAGGTPLFIESVLQHLLDIRCIDTRPGPEPLIRVADYVQLRYALNAVPHNLETLLGTRVKAVIENSPDRRHALHYLALASVLGLQIDETTLGRGLEMTEQGLLEMRLYFIRKGILAASLGDAHASFVHEVMQLSASAELSQWSEFTSIVVAFLQRFEPQGTRDLILVGRLDLRIGRLREARDSLNLAWEQADTTGIYPQKRTCLELLRSIYQRIGELTDRQTEEYLQMSLRLGESEMQAGSQTAAAAVLRDVLTRARRIQRSAALPVVVGPVQNALEQAVNLLMTLHVRRLEPGDYLEAAEQATDFYPLDRSFSSTLR